MTLKIYGLYVLVDFNTKRVHTRVITNREEANGLASELNSEMGTQYEVKGCFIDEEKS